MFVLTLVVLYYFHGGDILELLPNSVIVILRLLDGLILGNIFTYIRRAIQRNNVCKSTVSRMFPIDYITLIQDEMKGLDISSKRHQELSQILAICKQQLTNSH